MNTRHFFQAVLVVATALLLVSCGGLASAHKTGSFAFDFNPAMLGNASRIANPDGYVIRAHLYSTDGTYDKTEHKSIGYYELFDDEGEFTDNPPAVSFSFDEIPLHQQMNLKVDCSEYYEEEGEYTWLTTVTKRFTLTSSDPLYLNSSLFRDITTPYLFTAIGQYDHNLYAYLSSDVPDKVSGTNYLNMSGLTSYDNELYHQNAYCFFGGDEYSDMNLAYLVTANSYYAESYGNYNVSEENNLQSLLYDPVTQKLCVVYNENSDGRKTWKAAVLHQDAFTSLYAALENPSEYGRIVALGGNGSISPFSKDANIDFESDNVYEPPVAYAYDGYLYSLRSFDHEQSDKSITLCKFSLKTGALVSTTTVTIPQVSPAGSGYKASGMIFNFNDIAVSDGLVYILFHQQEMWVAGSFGSMYNFENGGYEDPSVLKPGYVDRGGIFVYDGDSLKKVDTLGVAPVNKTITVKFTNPYDYANPAENPEHMFFLYRNYDEATGVFSNPISEQFPLTWSVPEINSLYFGNPVKIVAIMPKKLVIAESGAFMYEGGRSSYSDIDKNLAAYKAGTDRGGRLVTVDLENFSKSTIEGTFSQSGGTFYSAQGSDSCFSFSCNIELAEGETLYAKKVTKDINNHYKTEAITYTNEDYEIIYAGATFMRYN